MNRTTTKDLVVVSGYYGFDNLGDEAILEELTGELKRLVNSDTVVVLSANPQATAKRYTVKAHPRMDLVGLAQLLKSAKLFVSGGGGLFQNTHSLGSILYYGLLIAMAKRQGAQVVVYAQGVGPLRGKLANFLTRRFLAAADRITVRDSASKALLDSWHINSQLTADPVWCLEQGKLPSSVEGQLNAIKSGRLIALSLRPSENFSQQHLSTLVEALNQTIPDNAHLLLLPLQLEQDEPMLRDFQARWRSAGRESTLIDVSAMDYPSQWTTLFGRCKLVIAMRLHALILALKAGVGVVGISYDPKVSQLLAASEQPELILTKELHLVQWQATLQDAVENWEKLGRQAMKKAESAKKLAGQNFEALATILDVQKHS